MITLRLKFVPPFLQWLFSGWDVEVTGTDASFLGRCIGLLITLDTACGGGILRGSTPPMEADYSLYG